MPTTRISCDLPEDLVRRLEAQAESTGVERRELIRAAITGLVREFEQIDAECGVVCPDCGAATEVDELLGGKARVCVRCLWRQPVVSER